MNKIITAIAIMDEKGRGNAEGNSIMLWEKDWNALRKLLLEIYIHQQAEAVEAGATIVGAVIDRLG